MVYSKICAIFGENPDELSFGYDEEYYTCAVLKMRLVGAMQEAVANGCDAFSSTLEQGACMWGAEACIAMRESGYETALIAVTSGEDQASRWHPERRERYYNLIEKSDVHADALKNGMSAEEYVLSTASLVILLGDTEKARIAKLFEQAKRACIEVRIVPSE